MDALPIKITDAGLAAIVNDNGTEIGPAIITQIGFTDAVFTATSALLALPGEIKRIAVSGQDAGDDVLHVVAVDESADAYEYRGFGLYFADGTLFAVYSQADPIGQKTAATVTHLVVDLQLEDGQAQNVTFGASSFLNPPATTTTPGVVRLATSAQAQAGTDDTIALTPATAIGAVLAWLQGREDAPDVLRDLLKPVVGSGSGFNVDKLDGHDAADFLLATDDETFGGNAETGWWEKRANGVLEQWGYAVAGETYNPPSITFLKPFSDKDSINLQVTARSPNPAATAGNKVGGNVVSETEYNLFSDDGNTAVFWRAIGIGA